MTQPSFVPIAEADQVRPARRLHVPEAWSPRRPAEIRVPARPAGRGMGTPGPDQGYALRLARRFADQIHLAEGESTHDVLVGCALLASRRAALFGRAPSVYDVTVSLTLWGFLGEAPTVSASPPGPPLWASPMAGSSSGGDPNPAPTELVEARRRAFRGAAHDYDVQRALVDAVPESWLRLAPPAVAERRAAGGWRDLVGAPEGERAS